MKAIFQHILREISEIASFSSLGLIHRGILHILYPWKSLALRVINIMLS